MCVCVYAIMKLLKGHLRLLLNFSFYGQILCPLQTPSWHTHTHTHTHTHLSPVQKVLEALDPEAITAALQKHEELLQQHSASLESQAESLAQTENRLRETSNSVSQLEDKVAEMSAQLSEFMEKVKVLEVQCAKTVCMVQPV